MSHSKWVFFPLVPQYSKTIRCLKEAGKQQTNIWSKYVLFGRMKADSRVKKTSTLFWPNNTSIRPNGHSLGLMSPGFGRTDYLHPSMLLKAAAYPEWRPIWSNGLSFGRMRSSFDQMDVRLRVVSFYRMLKT